MKAYMIMDLQYGSTGKGLLAGHLANSLKPDVVVTAWGPNAGHTYIDANGRKFIHRMLANGVVSPNLESILIGPGSVIDLNCLEEEIKSCADLLDGKVIVIHPHAAIVSTKHAEIEKRNVKIGSTMKGTGAAVIQRLERDPDNSNVAKDVIEGDWCADMFDSCGVAIYVDAEAYQNALHDATLIQIEGAQGFSLSIYHGMYPYTTSRDVTPAQVLADCAIPYHIRPEVFGTIRTFPIRVANRFDEDGNQIGTSGPCYPDQQELEWSDIGIAPELTTVTKLPRRIFSFSRKQLLDAVYQCAPSYVFINFANYVDDGQLSELRALVCESGSKVGWVGYGPTECDIDSHYPF